MIIIDICGTLFRSNTTFDFLHWKYKRKKTYQLYYKLYHLKIWKIANKLIYIIFRIDLTRVIAIRFLKGEKRRDLINDADVFFDEFLRPITNDKVFSKIEALRKSIVGGKLIIISATLDVIAESVARHTGFQLVKSTELEYVDGICSGRIKEDLLGKKLKFLNGNEPFSACFTDDISDLPLLINSQANYIIVYPRTKSRWDRVIKENNIEAEIIYISQNFYS